MTGPVLFGGSPVWLSACCKDREQSIILRGDSRLSLLFTGSDSGLSALANLHLPFTRGEHPCATFWADESLVLVFHHVMLSKQMGHESSSIRALYHVVGVCCSLSSCLLPLCATLRGVTFGTKSFLACLRVEMGIQAVQPCDVFEF